TSGIRLGTPAMTTRGMKEDEFTEIGDIIAEYLLNPEDSTIQTQCRRRVAALCEGFPLYSHLTIPVPMMV
ncbi:MAG: serine hydroxymethyltransferase, partial [Microcystaceae cyanobacterium]